MSNKWTVEKINKIILKADVCKKDREIMLVSGLKKNELILTRAGGSKMHLKDLGDIELYDQSMNLIEPPKEREFEIRCEFHQINSSVIKLLPENWSEDNYVKLPSGRRYKRYKDNGELVVIENE